MILVSRLARVSKLLVVGFLHHPAVDSRAVGSRSKLISVLNYLVRALVGGRASDYASGCVGGWMVGWMDA